MLRFRYTRCPTTDAHSLIGLCDERIINTVKNTLNIHIVPTSGHFIQKIYGPPETGKRNESSGPGALTYCSNEDGRASPDMKRRSFYPRVQGHNSSV